MAETNQRGPSIMMGSLEQQQGTSLASIEPMDGPGGCYQGDAILDPRGFPLAKDGTAPGRVPAFLYGAGLWAVDNKPQAFGTGLLAAAASVGLQSAVVLTTNAPGSANAGNPTLAVSIPILPQGTTTPVNVIALDFGFTTGTTTAASSSVVVTDNTVFQTGQWVCIAGAGNSGNTASLMTQVTSVSPTNFTGIFVSPLPTGSISNAPIGQAALYGTLYPPTANFGPTAPTPTYVHPFMLAGMQRVLNPRETIARNLSVTLTTGGVATTASFLVKGYDVWGQPMTELINVPATTSATTQYGQKAFKYVLSIANQSTSGSNTYAVGIGDTFGFPFRTDEWEQTEITWASLYVNSATGFLGAVSTTGSPATNTTGDVRGTIQLSTNGKGTAISTASASNGTSRLAVIQDLGVWNIIYTTPNNTAPMFGIQQSTT